MIKSRRMRWPVHVALMGRRGMHTGFWLEIQKERHHYEDLDVCGKIILRWILERYDGVVWTGCIWLRIVIVGALVNPVMNFRVP
jgi:hypothetical protein